MTKYNSLTGMEMKEDDNLELNSMTGDYFQRDKDTDVIEKNEGEPIWPSLSARDEDEHDEDPEQEQEAGQEVEKNKSSMADSIHRVLGGQGDRKQIRKSFSLNVPIFPFEKKDTKDEHVVMGIVYEPGVVDAQGDQANAEEIKKAAYYFMENTQTFKVMHKGKSVNVNVLESYISPDDFTIAKRTVKKGSWVMVTRVLDKKLWAAIKDGTYTGYSMAGTAQVEEN